MSSDQNAPEPDISALRDLFADAEDAVAQAIDPLFDEEAGLGQIRRHIAAQHRTADSAGSTSQSPHTGGPRKAPEPHPGFWTGGGSHRANTPDTQHAQGNLARSAATPESAQPLVRPYAMTGGSTRPRQLAIEALVSTSAAPSALQGLLPEHQRICALCREIKSVAEVSALLQMPLGVARILVADLAEAGMVIVHEPSASQPGARPDTTLLERVLSGLRKL
ncbi:Protein of unknown function [Streptomyces melanosporofaciens]|uniref:DUF742 domain-containing protein n=1 Tax=Streptomyces melanosporofaciens TaxID=67327 RepID=A0A1H4RDL1_STRMJ|nr:DUF742 domain-containing protein [Streptomyces melanosporofaciens]SEC29982.1 Protein of unknown function [Streptomyces melanosporofaciens]